MISWKCTVTMIFLPLVVNVLEIECMDMARDVSQQCEEDVDAEVNSTSGNQEDTERRNEDLSG
jgi:hypothetical protein